MVIFHSYVSLPEGVHYNQYKQRARSDIAHNHYVHTRMRMIENALQKVEVCRYAVTLLNFEAGNMFFR